MLPKTSFSEVIIFKGTICQYDPWKSWCLQWNMIVILNLRSSYHHNFAAFATITIMNLWGRLCLEHMECSDLHCVWSAFVKNFNQFASPSGFPNLSFKNNKKTCSLCLELTFGDLGQQWQRVRILLTWVWYPSLHDSSSAFWPCSWK